MKSIKLIKNLATRESARVLFKELIELKISILDFSEVLVVSRSFVNEFHNLEVKNNYFFKKTNMSKDVKFMFENADKKLDSDIVSTIKTSTVSLKSIASFI